MSTELLRPDDAPIRIMTADELREVDRLARDECAMPTLLLMEHAAVGLAETIIKALSMLREDGSDQLGRVLIVAGRGNNGGDGLAAARLLADAGVTAEVALASAHEKMEGDAATNLAMVESRDVPVQQIPERAAGSKANPEEAGSWLRSLIDASGPAVIIDAIMGTGLDRPLQGMPLGLVRAINASDATVIAADIPTGLHADTGDPMPEAVEADVTVTFAAIKAGFESLEAQRHIGEVIVQPIGVPPALLRRFGREAPDEPDAPWREENEGPADPFDRKTDGLPGRSGD